MWLALVLLTVPCCVDDPADVVAGRFYAAFASGNLTEAMRYWEPGAAATVEPRLAWTVRTECLTIHSLDVSPPRIGEDAATVDMEARVTVSAGAHGSSRHEIQRMTFELARGADGWRIRSWSHRETALAARAAEAPNAVERRAIINEAGPLRTARLAYELCRQAVRLSNAGRAKDGADLAEHARDIAVETGDLSALSNVYGVQSILLAETAPADVDASIELAAEGVALAERSGDPNALARALVRLGRAQFGIRSAVVREPFERVVALEESVSDASMLAAAASQLAFAAVEANDRAGQLRYGLMALRHAEISGEDHALYNSHFAVAEGYGLLGYSDLSIRHYERLLEVSKRAGWNDGVALSLAKLALTYAASGRAEAARAAIDRALAQSDELTRPALLVLRGQTALDRGDLEDAAVDLEEALCLMRQDDPARIGWMQSVLDLRLAQGRDAEAAVMADELFAAAARFTPREQLVARFVMVKMLRRTGRFDEARVWADDMSRRVEEIQASAAVDQRHWSLFYAARALYDRELVALAVDSGDAPEALRAVNDMKARALRASLEQKDDQKDDRFSTLSRPSDLVRERELEARIADLNRKLAVPGRAPMGIAALQADLGRARLDLQELHARAAALTAATPLPAEAGNALELAPSSAVVQYVSTAEGVMIIAVAPQDSGGRRVRIARIADTPYALRSKVDALLRLIENNDLRFKPAAREMYDLLLGPVGELMTPGAKLCVIPDEDLWRVPFQALVAPNGKYVAELVTLYYAPSMTLADLRRLPGPAREAAQAKTLLAFGNPQLNARSTATFRNAFAGEEVGDLPDAEREVLAIARLYDGARSRVYVGAEATEAVLKAHRERVSVLHFATHGAVDPASPLASALLLTPGAEDEDGLLEAREVFGLAVESDLVVLAACRTAAGRPQLGEGVVGIAWVFLAKGCPTAVVTQWRVSSKLTSDLMIEFHRYLLAGLSAAAALRKTQLRVMSDPRYRHPYYWAPFVVVGAQ